MYGDLSLTYVYSSLTADSCAATPNLKSSFSSNISTYPGSANDISGLTMWNTTTSWYDSVNNYMFYMTYNNSGMQAPMLTVNYTIKLPTESCSFQMIPGKVPIPNGGGSSGSGSSGMNLVVSMVVVVGGLVSMMI